MIKDSLRKLGSFFICPFVPNLINFQKKPDFKTLAYISSMNACFEGICLEFSYFYDSIYKKNVLPFR